MDLLIFSLPLSQLISPSVGAHLVKACVLKAGFSAKVVDLNMGLYQRISEKDLYYQEHGLFEYIPGKDPAEFFAAYNAHMRRQLEGILRESLELKPKCIGFSVFSTHSVYFAKVILEFLRQEKYGGNIVLGGPYATFIHRNPEIKKFLGDGYDVISGEAEFSIVEYLKGSRNYPGINSEPAGIEDLDAHPLPSYEPGDFVEYDKIRGHNRSVSITGSRGCVRKCTFCDTELLWPKYRWRSAQSIADEMIYLHKNFNRNDFQFVDSLINGNPGMLRELCQILADYRKREKAYHFWWGGLAICHRKEILTPADFDLMHAAGLHFVSIGVESGSESVRNHMKKNFSNEDLRYTFEQLHRCGISTTVLMLIGYVTETERDFQDTLDLLTWFKDKGMFDPAPGGDRRTIHNVVLGGTLGILPETRLAKHMNDNFGGYESIYRWSHGENTRLVRLERLFRALHHLYHLKSLQVFRSQNNARYKPLWDEYLQLKAASQEPNHLESIGTLKEMFINQF